MFDKLFDNIEETLKNIAKKLHRLLVIVGLCVAIIGFFKLVAYGYSHVGYQNTADHTIQTIEYVFEQLAWDYPIIEDRYDTLEGYISRQMVFSGIYCIFASLMTLPVYGFGVLIEEVKKIRKEITNPINTQENNF